MSETTVLLEREVAEAMWTWAWSELDAIHSHERRPDLTQLEAMLDVLTYLAGELSLAGSHEWIAGLPRLLKLHDGWMLGETSPRHKCLESVSELLRRGAPISKTVLLMARARDRSLRAAVAEGLPIDNPKARALLEQLRVDPDPYIRKLVTRRLPASEPSAWWVGKFESDPVPRLGEQANDEVIAALKTAVLFVDRDTDEQRAMLAELGPALAQLPTPILSELVRRFVTFKNIALGHAQMIGELLRRAKGTDELWAMLAPRISSRYDYVEHYLILKKLSHEWEPELVEQLCRNLLQGMIERRHDKRIEGMAALVDALLRDLWPPALPGGLLLDAWQTLAADAPELAKDLLLLLHHDRVDLRPEFERLLSLAERDASLVRALGCAAERLDPESRAAFVERAIASQSDELRALALQQLATLPPDPAAGSLQALFTRYWSEPKLRLAIVKDERLCEVFCPYMRRELHADALAIKEVGATLDAIGRLWGGAVSDRRLDEDGGAARRERAAAWHEGASELGPPTEAEWIVWRTLRQQRFDDEPTSHASVLLRVRPPGPLHTDDRAVVDRLMNRWREVWAGASKPADIENRRLLETLALTYTLCSVVDPHVLPLVEEVLAAVRALDSPLADTLEDQVEKLRLALNDL